MAFVPPDQVESVYSNVVLKEWENCKEELEDDADVESAQDFLAYLEKYFVGQKSRRGDIAPIFKMSLWNKHEALVGQDDDDDSIPVLTNNAVESYNSRYI